MPGTTSTRKATALASGPGANANASAPPPSAIAQPSTRKREKSRVTDAPDSDGSASGNAKDPSEEPADAGPSVTSTTHVVADERRKDASDALNRVGSLDELTLPDTGGVTPSGVSFEYQ